MLFVFCKPPPSYVGDERSSHFCPAVNNWEEKKVFFNRKNQKQEVDHWHLVDIYVGCIFENVSWGRSSQKKKILSSDRQQWPFLVTDQYCPLYDRWCLSVPTFVQTVMVPRGWGSHLNSSWIDLSLRISYRPHKQVPLWGWHLCF